MIPSTNTEYLESLQANSCCHACREKTGWSEVRMITCKLCGNKRCPKAENHEYRCTGSNELGQVGVKEDPPKPHCKVAKALRCAIAIILNDAGIAAALDPRLQTHLTTRQRWCDELLLESGIDKFDSRDWITDDEPSSELCDE